MRRGREGLEFAFVNTASLILVFKEPERGWGRQIIYPTQYCFATIACAIDGGCFFKYKSREQNNVNIQDNVFKILCGNVYNKIKYKCIDIKNNT